MINSEEINDLIGQGEGPNLEFNSVFPPPSVIARTIAAFANSDGGILVIGVDEEFHVIGLEDGVQSSAIIEAALDRIDPRPYVQHFPVELNGRLIYAIEIERSQNRHVTENNVFLREGAVTRSQAPSGIIEDSKEITSEMLGQLNEAINSEAKLGTEAKMRFLRQFRSIYKIADISTKLLCPSGSDRPSNSFNGKALMRLLLASLVDTFELYFTDLLYEIHLARPETLKSNVPVKVKEVLDCQNMTEFIQLAAEKRTQDLKRGHINEFVKSFKQSTDFDLFLNDESEQVNDIIEVRHLYTHSNGIIDNRFLSRRRERKFRPGDEHTMALDAVIEAALTFLNITSRTDNKAVNKYSLKTQEADWLS